MKKLLFVLGWASLLLAACQPKKADETVPVNAHGKAAIKVKMMVDSLMLVPNQFNYTNEAGNTYSVGNLEYYLSDMRLNGQLIKNHQYIQLQDSSTHLLSSSSVPLNKAFDTLSFVLGIDAAHNFNGKLAETIINENMEWPESLGGGYHFMRFEGQYHDAAKNRGFAIHLGKTPNQVQINLLLANKVTLTQSSDQLSAELVFNIAELLKSPHTINFKDLPSSIMSNDSLQILFAKNAKDAFRLKSVQVVH